MASRMSRSVSAIGLPILLYNAKVKYIVSYFTLSTVFRYCFVSNRDRLSRMSSFSERHRFAKARHILVIVSLVVPVVVRLGYSGNIFILLQTPGSRTVSTGERILHGVYPERGRFFLFASFRVRMTVKGSE